MYIGSSPNFGALDSQTITSANGSTATFTLNQYVPDSDSIIVTVGNVVQEPTEAYTASGNSITFTENVPNGDTIVVRYLGRSVDVYTGYKRVQRFKYVATNGQQTFSGSDANSNTLAYTAQDIDIFYNGVRLDESEFTATNGTSVILGTGATTNAELVILAYKVVQLADTVPASTGGTFTGNVVFSGNATVNGNLTASGTTTLVDTTNTVVKDNLLGLNHGASSNSNDAGIIIERGSTGNDALLIWDESADKWALGTTTSNASSTGNLNMTTGTLVANLEGTIQTASQTNITTLGTLTSLKVQSNTVGSTTDIELTDNAVIKASSSLNLNATSHNFYVHTSGASTGGTGSSTFAMAIDANGRVGLGGITTPSFTSNNGIHLADNYKIGFGAGGNGRPDFQLGYTSSTDRLSLACGFGSDDADIQITTGGLIGIGIGGGTIDRNVMVKDSNPRMMFEETSSGGSKRMEIGVKTDGTPFLSAEQSGGIIDINLTGKHTHRFTASQFISQHDDGSAELKLNASYSSGSGTPQFTMYRANTLYGFIEAGVNSLANGLGNHMVIYAYSGDVYAKDSSNNSTQLSPHNFAYIPDGASETGAWCYKSDKFETEKDGDNLKEKVKSGTYVSADMTKVVRQVEKLTGEKLIYKGTLDVNEDGNINKHIDDGSTVKDNIIADLIKRIEVLEKA